MRSRLGAVPPGHDCRGAGTRCHRGAHLSLPVLCRASRAGAGLRGRHAGGDDNRRVRFKVIPSNPEANSVPAVNGGPAIPGFTPAREHLSRIPRVEVKAGYSTARIPALHGSQLSEPPLPCPSGLASLAYRCGRALCARNAPESQSHGGAELRTPRADFFSACS